MLVVRSPRRCRRCIGGLCVCREGRNQKQRSKKQNDRSEFHFFSSPSRAGVEGCPDTHSLFERLRVQIETPPVSWLGGSPRIYPSVFDEFEAAARPSHPGCGSPRDPSPKKVASVENFPALQSRVGDGFSPSSHARSLV